MAKLKPHLAGCYEGALSRDASASGEVVAELVIHGDPAHGAVVTDARLSGEGSLLSDTHFQGCVIDRLHSVPLDAPSVAGKTTVRFPFHFEPSAH
ncbi:MAG: hypothetical protein HY791_25805 [Deltaproteobacteria bacterium]|nr:hypothetical protein [Deltaproteobacteria bacterium]